MEFLGKKQGDSMNLSHREKKAAETSQKSLETFPEET